MMMMTTSGMRTKKICSVLLMMVMVYMPLLIESVRTSTMRGRRDGRQKKMFAKGRSNVHTITRGEGQDEDEDTLNEARRLSWEAEYAITVAQVDVDATGRAAFQEVDCRYPMYKDVRDEFLYSIDNAMGGKFVSSDADFKIIEDAIRDQTGQTVTIDRSVQPSHMQGVLEMKTAEKGIPIQYDSVYNHLQSLKEDIDDLMSVCNDAAIDDAKKVSVSDRMKMFHKKGSEGNSGSALDDGSRIKVARKSAAGGGGKTTFWIFVIPCRKHDNLLSDVQVTIDIPLASVAHPQTDFIKTAVTGFMRQSTAAKIEAEFLNERKRTLNLPDITDPMVSSFWLLASYWAARGHTQKTSITCLPKVNMCELFKVLNKESEVITESEAQLFEQVLNDPELTKGLASLIPSAAWYRRSGSTNACTNMEAFNLHAGSFPIKTGDSRDGIEIAVEIRQANKADMASTTSSVKGYEASRVLQGEVTVVALVDNLGVEYSDDVKITTI